MKSKYIIRQIFLLGCEIVSDTEKCITCSNPCEDTNNICSNAFNGTGTCIDITNNPNWDDLDNHFDLSEPNIPGACHKSEDVSCCRCFKKKTCADTGCKDAYGGLGICLDVEGDMTNYDIDLEVGENSEPNLCNHAMGKECCRCFKLNTHSNNKISSTTTTPIPITTTTNMSTRTTILEILDDIEGIIEQIIEKVELKIDELKQKTSKVLSPNFWMPGTILYQKNNSPMPSMKQGLTSILSDFKSFANITKTIENFDWIKAQIGTFLDDLDEKLEMMSTNDIDSLKELCDSTKEIQEIVDMVQTDLTSSGSTNMPPDDNPTTTTTKMTSTSTTTTTMNTKTSTTTR